MGGPRPQPWRSTRWRARRRCRPSRPASGSAPFYDYICLCVYTYIYIYIHIHRYIHTYIYIYIYIHIHAYVHTCIHAYIYIYIYIVILCCCVVVFLVQRLYQERGNRQSRGSYPICHTIERTRCGMQCDDEWVPNALPPPCVE